MKQNSCSVFDEVVTPSTSPDGLCNAFFESLVAQLKIAAAARSKHPGALAWVGGCLFMAATTKSMGAINTGQSRCFCSPMPVLSTGMGPTAFTKKRMSMCGGYSKDTK